MDVMALFAVHGVAQAVATLGTATTPTTPSCCSAMRRTCTSASTATVPAAAPRGRRWVGAAADEGRAPGVLPVPCPTARIPDSIVRQEGMDGFDARLRREATPLSEFFFASLSSDEPVEPGRQARDWQNAASRCWRADSRWRVRRPDAAAADRTHRRRRACATARRSHVPAQRARSTQPSGAEAQPGAQRDLPHAASSILASELQPPYRFAALRQPGIELLSELVLLVRERQIRANRCPARRHFAERDEAGSLQKLAALNLPGEDALRTNSSDAMAQLDRQVLQQRLDELWQQQRDGGLSDADKQELRELLQAR